MNGISIKQNLIALASAMIISLLAFGLYFTTNVWSQLKVVEKHRAGVGLLNAKMSQNIQASLPMLTLPLHHALPLLEKAKKAHQLNL